MLTMIPKTAPRHRRFLPVMILPLLLSLACAGGNLFNRSASTTPVPTATLDAILLQVEVTVIYPSATPTPIATNTPIPSPTPFPTDTPIPTFTPPPTNTPAPPTPIPTNTPPVPPTPEIVGVISPVEPQHNLTLPARVRDFEFKWQWSVAQGCAIPPIYAFELRIWPARPGFGPLPAMDPLQSRTDVFCDPTSGLFGYRVDNLKRTPGAQAVAVETAGTGPFNWNVALLRIFPDITPLAVSEPRTFIIPDEYVGPYDTSRPTVTCLNFSEWLEAQALFLATGGPGQDLNGLDPDGNGIACDELRK